MPKHRVTVDTGGTFSDFVFFDEDTGQITITKVPSTPREPFQAPVLGGLCNGGVEPLPLPDHAAEQLLREAADLGIVPGQVKQSLQHALGWRMAVGFPGIEQLKRAGPGAGLRPKGHQTNRTPRSPRRISPITLVPIWERAALSRTAFRCGAGTTAMNPIPRLKTVRISVSETCPAC